MFFPWYDFALLAIETNSVVQKRLARIGLGGPQSFDEIWLMLSEKGEAAYQISVSVALGDTLSSVVDRLRIRVASNEVRLSA